jgi:hypothetical protein
VQHRRLILHLDLPQPSSIAGGNRLETVQDLLAVGDQPLGSARPMP